MSNIPDISQIQKKAFYSTIIDGSYELIQSVLLFITGFFFINIYIEFVMLILFIIILRFRKKIISNFKEKYIYPRIGFINLQKNHQKLLSRFNLVFTVIMALSLVIFFIYIFQEGWSINTTLKFVPIIASGALFGSAIYICFFSGKWNYIWVGIGGVFLCLLFLLLPFSTGKEHIIYFAWTASVVLFLIGFTKYRIFLKKNPIIEQVP